jgi:phage baseplate assembly protein W
MSNGVPVTVPGSVPGAGLPAKALDYFRTVNAMWPDLLSGRARIAPARNGVDRFTGKLLQGWPHVEQSMEVIFATPYHQRVLRRWVGSFVPHILGESGVARIITRFFWAIVTAIDLWEPDYRIQQVFIMGEALRQWSPMPAAPSASEAVLSISAATDFNQLFRQGQLIFRTEGTWYPRGHLGDFTPYARKASGLVSRGGNFWDVVPVGEAA